VGLSNLQTRAQAQHAQLVIFFLYFQVEQLDGLQHMHIPSGQQYKSPGEAYVEGDASSASYFLAGTANICDKLSAVSNFLLFPVLCCLRSFH